MTRSEMINKKDKQNISKIKSKPLKEFGLFLSGIMLSFMIIFIAFIFSSCSFNVDKDSVNNKNDEKISSKLPERQSQIMNSEDVILPKVIELSMAKPKLQVGETQQLLTTVLPANATNKSVVYTTNNVEIASVSNEGMVTARNGGTCIITVKANVDLSVKKTYKVTVMPKQKQDVEPQKFEQKPTTHVESTQPEYTQPDEFALEKKEKPAVPVGEEVFKDANADGLDDKTLCTAKQLRNRRLNKLLKNAGIYFNETNQDYAIILGNFIAWPAFGYETNSPESVRYRQVFQWYKEGKNIRQVAELMGYKDPGAEAEKLAVEFISPLTHPFWDTNIDTPEID